MSRLKTGSQNGRIQTDSLSQAIHITALAARDQTHEATSWPHA